jgi:molybdate transport system ATP-binding protein
MTREHLRARLEARVGRLLIDVELDCGGGTLVVVGPNGSGKTSLLSLLIGTLPVERGRITIGGSVLLDTSVPCSLPIERRQLGYVPQDYGLFPHLTVQANLEFALRSAYPRLARAERDKNVDQLLAELDLTMHRARRPETLSGGEKQRVALARALSVRPRALLLDEPMAALDVLSRREVVTFLSSYLRALALPTLLVTHDPSEARLLGQTFVVLEDGRITQRGTWEDLARQPRTPFVERFVAAAMPQASVGRT